MTLDKAKDRRLAWFVSPLAAPPRPAHTPSASAAVPPHVLSWMPVVEDRTRFPPVPDFQVDLRELLSNLVYGRAESSGFPAVLRHLSFINAINEPDIGDNVGELTEAAQASPAFLGAHGELMHEAEAALGQQGGTAARRNHFPLVANRQQRQRPLLALTQFLVFTVRSRMVAKEDSMGLVVPLSQD